MGIKQNITGRGFFLGSGIHIKSTNDTISDYIPFPPFYCDKTTVDGIFNAYGNITEITDFI